MSISAYNFHLMIAWDCMHAAESALRLHRSPVGPAAPMAIISAQRWTKAARKNIGMAAQAARELPRKR